mgnify:CR=1 FL=1
MRVNPKDGRCRECGSELEIVDADDATMIVECVEGGHLYAVEPDAFGDGVDLEAGVGLAHAVTLFQHDFPRKPGLVDFQHQALEQLVICAGREAVLGVVMGAVDRVSGGDIAVGAHGANSTGVRGKT